MTPSIVQFVFHDHQITFALIPLLMTLIIFMWSVLEEVLKNTFSSYLISNLFIWIMTTIMTMTILLMLKKTAFCMEECLDSIQPFQGFLNNSHIDPMKKKMVMESMNENVKVYSNSMYTMFSMDLRKVTAMKILESEKCCLMKRTMPMNEMLATGFEIHKNQPGPTKDFYEQRNFFGGGGFSVESFNYSQSIGVLRNMLLTRPSMKTHIYEEMDFLNSKKSLETLLLYNIKFNRPMLINMDKKSVLLAYFYFVSYHNSECLPWLPEFNNYMSTESYLSVMLIIEHKNGSLIDIMEMIILNKDFCSISAMSTALEFVKKVRLVNTPLSCVIGDKGLTFIHMKSDPNYYSGMSYSFDPKSNEDVTKIINMEPNLFLFKFNALAGKVPIFYENFSSCNLFMLEPSKHSLIIYVTTISSNIMANS